MAPTDENGNFDTSKIADPKDFGDWEEQGCQGAKTTKKRRVFSHGAFCCLAGKGPRPFFRKTAAFSTKSGSLVEKAACKGLFLPLCDALEPGLIQHGQPAPGEGNDALLGKILQKAADHLRALPI